MKKSGKKAETPSLILTFTEAARTCLEGLVLAFTAAAVRRTAPQGDNSPVLFIPGFMTGDLTTKIMRDCVGKTGYRTYGWDQGLDVGLNSRTFRQLEKRLGTISQENGGAPVAIVAHSLGGIYARELARTFPNLVSKVITLGSPFAAGAGEGDAAPMVKAVFDFMHAGHAILNDEELQQAIIEPPPQPTTSVYSEADGIVHWKACLNPERPQAENIEVCGSHLGMVVNPLVLLLVLDRLAEPVENWKPFDPERYPQLQQVIVRTSGRDRAPGLEVERCFH